ncbi:MAG: carboxypeptidase-like regulatory domain-containing protein [Betaproteobacteria bacterium]
MHFAKWIVVTAVLVLSACTEISGGPVEGKLTDIATGTPIGGASVLVKWDMSTGGLLGGTHYVCYRVEYAKTDANGVYRIPRWTIKLARDGNGSQMRVLPFNQTVSMQVNALKAGYLGGSAGVGGTESRIDLKARKFDGNDEEWFVEWWKVGQFDDGCIFGGASRDGLEAKLAVYEQFGHTKRHREIIDYIKLQLHDPKYGLEKRIGEDKK